MKNMLNAAIMLCMMVPGISWATDVSWTSKASMNTARSSPAALSYDGQVFAIAGLAQDGTRLGTLEKYDPASNAWTTLLPMPTGRPGLAFVETGEMFYALGGEGSTSGRWAPEVEVYNPATNTWSSKNDWAVPRNDLAYGAINGKIYLAGGRTGYGGTVATCEEYDPASDSWSTKTDMPLSVLSPASGVIDGKLYVAGGQHKDSETHYELVDSLQIYDPVANTWSTGAPMPTAFNSCCGVVSGNMFYVFGHASSGITVLAYDTETDTWETLSQNTAPDSYGAGACADGVVYYFGGDSDGTRSDETWAWAIDRLELPSTAAYVGDTVFVSITATFDAPTRSASMAFTVESSFIDSVTLTYSAFDGLSEASSVCNMNGDTVFVGLAAAEALSLTDEPVAHLRFHIKLNASPDTISLAWIADETDLDDVTPTLTDGELGITAGYGDVSRDGQITSHDAQMVLEQFARIRNDVSIVFADVSDNGRISAYDAALILYKVVNESYRFPVQDGDPPARAAHTAPRTLQVVQSGSGWVISVNDARGICSGGLTLNMPGEYAVRVTGGMMSAGSRDGDDVHVGFVSDGSGNPVLLHIEPVGATAEDLTLPGIVDAELNEGAIPLASTLVPTSLSLSQNAPNPFNPVTTIGFSLPEAGAMNLVIYDALGRQVRTLVSGQAEAGVYSVAWDGRDAVGRPVASGVYVYRLTTASGTLVRRMTMIR